MKRIALFLLTNIGVLIVLSISMRLLGLESYFTANYGLDLGSLLVFAAIIGFAGSFISLAISKWSAKFMTKAHVIKQPADATEAWLLETVARQAERAGIGMPEVAIYAAPDINAFATGMSRNNALVAVSSGLLENMSRDEAEAVLAHEVSHVANGDMITMALIQGVVNTFVIFLARVIGWVVDRVILKNDRGPGLGYWVSTIVAELVLAFLASAVVMWFSRKREFRADAGAAELVGREKMVAALQRLQASHDPVQLPDQLAAFGIAGGGAQGWKRLFLSHPPLEERIAALRAG
ncbi:MAG: protease HtpX [Gammaproteobacteria bacterium]|nr:protease HtpX [Gammaproteobacteria bacterium]MCF6260905.1 protease HtpX [Gammaproteobacteria bacterium]